MTGFERVIVQHAVNEHLGMALHERLNLCLPLFRADESRRGKHSQNFLYRACAAQQVVKWAAAGHAFAALSGEDQCTALLQHTGAGAHALDTLIQVEIQRVAAVRRDDDVERLLNTLHGRVFDKRAAALVRLDDVAGEHIRDVALLVEGDV